MNRQSLERQIVLAANRLETKTAELNSRGVAAGAHRADPAWRSLNASHRQLKARLRRIGEIEQLDADLKARKAGGASEGEDAADEE
ncbi:MAG: hypothetical protein KF774_21255 [Planctomyces sp.]|nr:hypothetical protein [Planctomyces sp.]